MLACVGRIHNLKDLKDITSTLAGARVVRGVGGAGCSARRVLACEAPVRRRCGPECEREFFIDNLLVQIHLIMSQMFLVDRPRAMGV